MPANSAASGEESIVGEAVRLRLRALVRSLGDSPGDESSEQMLMDIDVDGQRYLLIRMPAVTPKGVSLSPREVEIVRLVAEGHQNKVIASVLEISNWTVCTHMRRVFAKFGVTSRAAMVARVAALGGIVDGMLAPQIPRGRALEEEEEQPRRAPVRHPLPVRRLAPVPALTGRGARGLPAARSASARAGAAQQTVR